MTLKVQAMKAPAIAIERLQMAACGRGGVIAIGGEAGVGKTSLVDAFAAAHDDDARILWSGCEALSTPRALGPLHVDHVVQRVIEWTQVRIYFLLQRTWEKPELFASLHRRTCQQYAAAVLVEQR